MCAEPIAEHHDNSGGKSMRQIMLAILLALSASTTAYAHAHLKSTTPAANATLATPPTEVVIDFSEAIEPKFSSIEVKDAKGTRLDKNDAHLAPDNPKHLVVSLNPLEPGTYAVDWKVTSVDTHKTHGSFSFKVGN
jgi:methionine-rich copper-binding protein CopC